MELRDLLELLKRRWWIILGMSVLAGCVAFYVSKQMTPIYKATTTVLVNQTQTNGVIQYNDVLTSERLTSTYAQLVKRRQIFTEVKRRLALSLTEEELSKRISVSPIQNTQLLRIDVEGPVTAEAVKIANTTADVFIEDNSKQLGSRPGNVSIAEEASEPRNPVKPNIVTNTLLAGLLGIMLGAAIAFALEYMDDTVKTTQDVEKLTGLTTLGTVTRFRQPRSAGASRRSPRQPVAIDPGSGEDYRQIRTNIHFSLLGPGPKTILITSANPREGKSTSASNLAVVLAQAGHQVILIDTDLRRPMLHTNFGASNSYGLTGLLLSGTEDPSGALLDTHVPGLRLLPSGPIPPNPSELLMSPAVHSILLRIKTMANYVIMDSPPVLAVTDAKILAGQCDATVLIAERGRTRTESFQRAHAALAQANVRIIGVILNKMKRRTKNYYQYGYYHATPSSSKTIAPKSESPEVASSLEPS